MVTRGAAVLLLAGLAAGCGAGPERRMVSIPPPRGWEENLALERSRREQWARGPDSPLPEEARPGFEGLEFWGPAPEYYFVGDVQPYAQPERFEIPTTSGKIRPCERVGWISFAIGGSPLRLQVYRLLDSPDPNDLFLPFQDETSGAETYPAGRYVKLAGDGPWVLDFNTAFNPSCAYGSPERFACPVTPAENRLPVRIEAGERGFREPAS